MPTRSKWEYLPTEAINPASLAMDTAPSSDIVELMITEDRKTIAAVHRERERIALGVEIITEALQKGGQLIFVGAGTSGRLGVLEAAEMLPTFGTSPRLVRAIMVGGQAAFFRPKEGVENNYEEGARAAQEGRRLRAASNWRRRRTATAPVAEGERKSGGGLVDAVSAPCAR